MTNTPTETPNPGGKKPANELDTIVEEARLEGDESVLDPDFQSVLEELLNAYKPILEEDLNRTRSAKELTQEALDHPESCEDEFAAADALFGKFITEQYIIRLLHPQARELLGPVDRWRWCLLHIRCCIIFGWLVCRRQRTFRAYSYYLYRFWRCVREVLGTPVSNPLTVAERADFTKLVQVLAGAYKPYLTDQLASVEFPLGLPDEIIGGRIDCQEGEDEISTVFERLLTAEVAPALLGEEMFAKHSREPFFWFCRCWCLCAIRFGCCLARARNLREVFRCLRYYRACLRECFQPLRCDLTAPTGCAEEQPGLIPGGVGLSIEGTAAGAFFHHYTLEWRIAQGQNCTDNTGWSGIGITYPGGGANGTIAVSNGTLGWINTTTLTARSYQIRLCAYSSQSNVAACCHCIEFVLFKKLVWIDRVADLPGAPVRTPPGPFDGGAPIVSANPGGIVVPVGGCISVKGSAYVGECQDRQLKCVDLRAAVGWWPGPTDAGFAASLPLYIVPMLQSPICYDDPDPAIESARRAQWNQLIGRTLTVRWVKHTIDLGGGNTLDVYKLENNCFNSPASLPIAVKDGALCPDPHHRCRSGQYTLLLDVTDTMGNHYYDTQQVWFDNKPMISNHHVVFAGIEKLPSCSDMSLEKFVPQGAPCRMVWPAYPLGIAYDEYIDETDLTYPSDNFDFYTLSITRQGGPTYQVPITIAPDPGNPTHGLLRRGQPGDRCEPLPASACGPAQLVPGQSFDVLTELDMRAFDAVCVGSMPAASRPPAGFALERGTCCGYTFQLYAQDKTWSDGWAGAYHHAWSLPWAVCICNDLPRKEN